MTGSTSAAAPAAPPVARRFPPGPGLVGLAGGVELVPETAPIDRELIRRRPRRAVVIPTATVPAGDAALGRVLRLAQRHFRRIGAICLPIIVCDRADADDPILVAQLKGAGLIHLCDGDAGHLASCLVGSALGDALLEAWQAGTSVGGCGAGAAVLGEACATGVGDAVARGFGLFPGRVVCGPILPDRGGGRDPREVRLEAPTALIGSGRGWSVWGEGMAWQGGRNGPTPLPVGSRLDLPPSD